jgi:hypothetical protein
MFFKQLPDLFQGLVDGRACDVAGRLVPCQLQNIFAKICFIPGNAGI